MKYYAVTDDPRELYHYGVKGMKWGQHLFGDNSRPKSQAYKRVSNKLRSLVGNRRKEEHKYENAVKKSQDRIKQIENLYRVDQEKQQYDNLNREYNLARKRYKRDKRREDQYARNEANMDKILEKARRGKLKYGKLSPDQIQRIQDRLQMEANTRKLGSTEKTWYQQKKEARRAGKLQGITRGTAAAMEEVARAGANLGINGLKKMLSARSEGIQERVKNREKNRKTHGDLRKQMRDEAYGIKIRDADRYSEKVSISGALLNPNARAAKYLKEHNAAEKQKEEQKRLEEEARKRQERIEDENRKRQQKLLDNAYNKLLNNKNDSSTKREEVLKNVKEIKKLIAAEAKEEEKKRNKKAQSEEPKKEEKKKERPKFEDYNIDDINNVPEFVRKAGSFIDNTYSKKDDIIDTAKKKTRMNKVVSTYRYVRKKKPKGT